MLLAYDYPLLDVFWTMLFFFFWVAWIIILFRTVVDVFRSKDLGGFSKALWLLFVIVIPWLGVLIYLIVRGDGMFERDMEVAQRQQTQMDNYIRATAAPTSSADELVKLAQLRDSGVLTEAEFAAQKAKILG
jgi:hypothetical protein